MSVVDRGTPPSTAEGVKCDRSPTEDFAILLAARPAVLAKLLDEHRADSRGHCSICTLGGQRGHQIWPCNIAAVALRAAQIRGGETQR